MEPAAPVAAVPPPADPPEAPATPPVVELRRGAPSMADFSDLERSAREEAGKLATRLDRLERERQAPPPAAPAPADPAAPAASSPFRWAGVALVVLLVFLAVAIRRRQQAAG